MKKLLHLFLLLAPHLSQAAYRCPSIDEVNKNLHLSNKNSVQFIDVSTGFVTPWTVSSPITTSSFTVTYFMGAMIPTKNKRQVNWPTCFYAYTESDDSPRLGIQAENQSMQNPFKGIMPHNNGFYWEEGDTCNLPGTAIDVIDCLFENDLS